MQLWGFENFGSKKRADAFLQQAAGRVGSSNRPSIEDVPDHNDGLPEVTDPNAEYRPVRVTFISATPEEQRRYRVLVNHPNQVQPNHPLWRHVRSYRVDVQDVPNAPGERPSGIIGDNPIEQQALARAIRERIPDYDRLRQVAPNPTISQRDRSGTIVSQSFALTEGQEATINNASPADDPAANSLSAAPNLSEIRRMIREARADLARVKRRLESGEGEIWQLMIEAKDLLAKLTRLQAKISSLLAIAKKSQNLEEMSKATERNAALRGHAPTDATAANRDAAAMTRLNSYVSGLQAANQEIDGVLKDAQAMMSAAANDAQDTRRDRDRAIERGQTV